MLLAFFARSTWRLGTLVYSKATPLHVLVNDILVTSIVHSLFFNTSPVKHVHVDSDGIVVVKIERRINSERPHCTSCTLGQHIFSYF